MTTESATRPARERLLAAAGELFYEQGIAATGVDAVLARAGVSPSTLYAHFPGKDALVAAYLERRHRVWVQTWDELLDGRTDPAERLLSVFDALALYRTREGSRRGCAFLAAATELPAGHPAQAWLEADSRMLTGRQPRSSACRRISGSARHRASPRRSRSSGGLRRSLRSRRKRNTRVTVRGRSR